METTLKILKALSDKNRLRILAALMKFPELCACQITELLQISGAAVSRHLSLLTGADLLAGRKEGRWIFFRLTSGSDNKLLIQWIEQHLSGAGQIQKDEALLSGITSRDPEEICRKQRGEACCPEKNKIIKPEGATPWRTN